MRITKVELEKHRPHSQNIVKITAASENVYFLTEHDIANAIHWNGELASGDYE